MFPGIATALGFLSRLPVPSRYFDGENARLEECTAAFPAAGCVIALPACVLAAVASWAGFSPFLVAVLAVAALVATCGGLHEDGLADVADGFFAEVTLERRLEILRDSTIGVYAALALVLSLLLRVGLLASILEQAGVLALVLALLATAAVSRAAIVRVWHKLPPARADGLSFAAGTPSRERMQSALLYAGLIAGFLILPGFGLAAIVMAGLLVMASLHLFCRLCRRKIGGQTGDVLGAAQQIAEIAMLAGLVITL